MQMMLRDSSGRPAHLFSENRSVSLVEKVGEEILPTAQGRRHPTAVLTRFLD